MKTAHLIGRQQTVAADHAEELLPAYAAPGMQVELVEEVLDDKACVANVAPHLFDHVRLFFEMSGQSEASQVEPSMSLAVNVPILISLRLH